MGHLKTFSMKAITNVLPVFLILTFVAEVNWVNSLIISLILTALAYLIGDIYILPKTGNLLATIADGGLALLLLWSLRYFTMIRISNSSILYIVIAVILVEGILYHPYLKRLVSIDSLGPVFGKRK